MKKTITLLLTLAMLFCIVSCSETKGAYTFTYNGNKIAIDEKAESTLAAIGTPVTSQELGTCGIGEKDKLFVYKDFRIMTYQMDGVDYFYQIELLTDQVVTEEGIAIGAAADAVSAAYGTPETSDTGEYTYSSNGVDLIFYFSADQTVSRILYKRAE